MADQHDSWDEVTRRKCTGAVQPSPGSVLGRHPGLPTRDPRLVVR